MPAIVILDPENSDPAWGLLEDARIIDISEQTLEYLQDQVYTMADVLRYDGMTYET